MRSGAARQVPHLTPRTLVGERFPPDVFGDIKVAIINYCPPCSQLANYSPERVKDQHFIHVSPDSVRVLTHGGKRYLSLAHIYGGPVSATTVEELAYYRFEAVLGYGLAGSLGTKGLKMGDFYLVEDAFVADGTSRHYTDERVVNADAGLRLAIEASFPEKITRVRAATGDALYREHDEMLDRFRDEGCDIVNLDSSHLFAAAIKNSEDRAMRAITCGVVSDVIPTGAGALVESTLSVMLSSAAGGINPNEKLNTVVKFYIETLGPTLA